MPALKVTRRQALAAAGLLGAAGSVAAGARLASWWARDASEPYAVLDADEAELFDAIGEAAFPPGGNPPLSGRDAGVARYLDGVLASMPEVTRNLLRLLLHALDDWSRVSRGARFAALSLGDRSDTLVGFLQADNHLVRGAFTSVLVFVASAYCGHPDVKSACGWAFPCGYER